MPLLINRKLSKNTALVTMMTTMAMIAEIDIFCDLFFIYL